jgi:hypothetical protein
MVIVCSRNLATLALLRLDQPAGGGIKVAGQGPEELAEAARHPSTSAAADGEVNHRSINRNAVDFRSQQRFTWNWRRIGE